MSKWATHRFRYGPLSSMTQSMEPNSPVRKNDITADKFEVLLQRLDPDRDRAGERYEEIRWKLVRFFQWNYCLDAEECADETFSRVAEKITSQDEDILDVTAYVWGVAKKIRQEALRKEARTIRLPDLPNEGRFLGQSGASERAQWEAAERQRRLQCLRKCIQHLSSDERTLLLAYHAPRKRRPEARRLLAVEYGLTMPALRVRTNRLRSRLEECIKQCLAAS